MATTANDEVAGVVQTGTRVAAVCRDLRQRRQRVQHGQRAGGPARALCLLRYSSEQGVVERLFERHRAVVRLLRLALVLLQLLRDEAFGGGQRLLADVAQCRQMLTQRRGCRLLPLVVVGGLAELRGAALQEVAEDLVVPHLQAANPAALALGLL